MLPEEGANESVNLRTERSKEESRLVQNAHNDCLLDANFANLVALQVLREGDGKSSEGLADGQDVGKCKADKSPENGSSKHHG
jgi:hypothetical protein